MKKILIKLKSWCINITKDNTHLLHLILGTYLTQLIIGLIAVYAGFYSILIAFGLVTILEGINECYIDSVCDWKDFIWTEIGIILGIILKLL